MNHVRKTLLLILMVMLCGFAPSAANATRYNIVLFLIDDLGWRDLGCYGSDFYRTPHIDRLAANGVRFTDAYAACAVCSPTRASILTGTYPARLLLTNWLPSGRWDPRARLREGRFVRGLPMEERTLAEVLRDAGYRTIHIGKWPSVSIAGRVVQEPVISNDLYPTCLAAAGLSALSHQHVDGVNLKPLLNESKHLPARSLFWHFPHYNKHPSSVPCSVIRKAEWKLIESFDPAGMELYNLVEDLSETRNLVDAQPERRDTLRQELELWRVSVGAERMLPNSDFGPRAAPEQ